MKVKILVVQENAKASNILGYVKSLYPLQTLHEFYVKKIYEIRVAGIRTLVVYNGSPDYDGLRGLQSEFEYELFGIAESELDDKLRLQLKHVCRPTILSEQEYLDKKNRLKVELDKNLRILDMKFTHSRRRFKVGDKIINHIGSCIQVESIGTIDPNSFYNTQDVPLVGYKGTLLTKKLLPYKNCDKLIFIDNAHEALELIT